MRNSADHIDAKIERALEIAGCAGESEIAVLREGHELEIEIGLHPFFHVQQGLDRQQPIVAHIDVAANREQSLRHREIAISKGAFDHRLVGQMGLQLAPKRDALEQRAGDVEARLPKGQR